jgi:hypothetical protein
MLFVLASLFGYQMRTFIEDQLPKLDVAGSNPVSRSMFSYIYGH